MDNKGNELDLIEIESLVQLDQLSLPIDGFSEPLITVCFNGDDQLFILLYHRI